MSGELLVDDTLWYAVQTKPREEIRADMNLRAQNLETFFPLVKEERPDPLTKERSYTVKPLFPRYLFARFNASRMLHKVNFTRGVHSLVRFGGVPVPVDEAILEMIAARTGEDGYVRLGDPLKPGDKVVVSDGPFKNLVGVFERHVKQSARVMIMLTAVNYQSRVVIERAMVRKFSAASR